MEGNNQDKYEGRSGKKLAHSYCLAAFGGRGLHFVFYVHVYRETMRRENKPNAILIVSTFQHVSSLQGNHHQT